VAPASFLQAAVELAGHALKSGADLAGVDQAAGVIVRAEQQRAQATHDRVFVTTDDELLAQQAFDLAPAGVARAATVGRHALLGDDSLEAHLAGLREDPVAVADDVVDVTPCRGRLRAQRRAQPHLALVERQRGQVGPVEVKDVEHEVDELRARAAPAPLHRLKAGAPVGQHRGDLAVEQRASDAQLLRAGDDRGEVIGPLLVAPAEQRDAPVLDQATDAVAVELDLVQPLLAGGRLVEQLRQLRVVLNQSGNWIGARPC